MSHVSEWDYTNAGLLINLPGEYKLCVGFYDTGAWHCRSIGLGRPPNSKICNIYTHSEWVIGPNLFFHEALQIIECVRQTQQLSIPQIYALLLPATAGLEAHRLDIEKRYNVTLNGRVWNRVDLCPMTRCDVVELYSRDMDPYMLDWDEMYPVNPRSGTGRYGKCVGQYGKWEAPPSVVYLPNGLQCFPEGFADSTRTPKNVNQDSWTDVDWIEFLRWLNVESMCLSRETFAQYPLPVRSWIRATTLLGFRFQFPKHVISLIVQYVASPPLFKYLVDINK